jgi:hypothetical protein
MVLILPPRHVQPHFADHGLGDAHVDAIDPREVDTADAMQFLPQVKPRRMAARLPPPLGTGASLRGWCRGRRLGVGLGLAELGGEALQLIL